MAIDFPNSPTVNDIYTAGGKTWQWNGTYWSAYGVNPTLRASDTAPLSPNANDLWHETSTGSLFTYVDGYWVELGASAPVTASAGDLTGATLASNVLASSLTSVGILTSGTIIGGSASTVQVATRVRRDTSANWTSFNPTLTAGEQGLETDTNYIKIGDGSTVWTNLQYMSTLYQDVIASQVFG